MLQTALAHAGGMRIDHAMGLNRLWVIPDGATGAEGAYLGFPQTDLLRLIRLESHRHRAVILAEDLGTVPDGFQDRLRESGIDGMRVLWFERTKAERLHSPGALDAARRRHDQHARSAHAGRLVDRAATSPGARRWARCPIPPPRKPSAPPTARPCGRPPAGPAPPTASCLPPTRPPALRTPPASMWAASACELVMLPVEDALGLVEQPNLPGTLDEHPELAPPSGRRCRHPAGPG